MRRCIGWSALCLALCLPSGLRAQILDAGFTPNPSSDVHALAVQTDGKILIGGTFTRVGTINRGYLARLLADGSVDTTFNPAMNSSVYGVALQADGKILAGGFFTTVAGQTQRRLVRLLADGRVDPTFNANVVGNAVRTILVLPDNKILIGGDFTSAGGQVRAGIARLQPDGTLDASFVADASGSAPGSAAGVFTLARLGSGQILLGGQFTTVNGVARRGFARVSADGVLDPGVDLFGGASTSVTTLVVQRDGRVLIGGGFNTIGLLPRLGVARLNPDLTVDPTFNPAPAGSVLAVAEQPDGRILIGGSFTAVAGQARGLVARLNPDGSLDGGFVHDASGTLGNPTPIVLALQAGLDGRVLIAGSFTTLEGQPRSALARLVAPTPQIITAPADTAVAAGGSVTLRVVAAGSSLTYQWRKDGVALSGATSPTLTLTGIGAAQAGRYDVVVSNSLGTVTSFGAVLSLVPPPVFTIHPADTTLIAGLRAVLVCAAAGNPAPGYQWQKNGVAVPGATTATLTIAAAQPADSGVYTCVATNPGGSVTSAPATLLIMPRAQLANVSVRTALTAGQSLIVGFAVGNGTAPVLVRAAGPALGQFRVPNVMADPRIELYRDATKLVENDNWPSVLAPTFAGVGAFGFAAESRDAALLEPTTGSRSVVVSGGGAGVVLVEAYDTGPVGGPRLVNVSARNRVGTGDDILIAGIAVSGFSGLHVLIRAVGPTLGLPPFGLTGVLADPKLEVYDDAGVKIAENDNWDAATGASFAGVGAFALAPGSRDAALQMLLGAGRSYTVQVRGADGGTGVAIVEVYEVP